jgi:hypothetical protein
LDDLLRLDLITREEVGRGLKERTLAVDHGGVFLVADRRHDSPHPDGRSCKRGMIHRLLEVIFLEVIFAGGVRMVCDHFSSLCGDRRLLYGRTRRS